MDLSVKTLAGNCEQLKALVSPGQIFADATDPISEMRAIVTLGVRGINVNVFVDSDFAHPMQWMVSYRDLAAAALREAAQPKTPEPVKPEPKPAKPKKKKG